MSASLTDPDWNFRITDNRLVTVKAKHASDRKIAVIDSLTKLPFTIEVTDKVDMENLEVEKEYLATLEVYASKNLEGINEDFIDFFEALDIDQSMEDFVKAYWIYNDKIKFLLVEVEPS